MYHFLGCLKSKSPRALLHEGCLSELYINQTDDLLYSNTLMYAKTNESQIYLFGKIYNPEYSQSNLAKAVLNEFLKRGNDALLELDGEFTLIIKSSDETIIFRDRHGSGPQVYFTESVFTSDLKAFRHLKNYSCEPNFLGLKTFLNLGYIPSPMSSLKGVSKLPAGNLLLYRNGLIEYTSLYSWKVFNDSRKNSVKMSIEEAAFEYERIFLKSIRNRISGQANVGVLLSGGYDSGGNIVGLHQEGAQQIRSYSIGFKDNAWTELPIAKKTAERYNSEHREYEINGSEITHLPKIVDFFGDPFWEGGLMINYIANELAQEDHCDLIIGGDGNDHHFGTAGKELAMNHLFRKSGIDMLQKTYASLGHHKIFKENSFLIRSQYYNNKILNVVRSDSFGFDHNEINKLTLSGNKYHLPHYLNEIPDDYKNFNELYAIKNYFIDILQTTNESYLFKASQAALLHGNSMTFPYMSTEMYNFLKTMPRTYKHSGSIWDIARGKGQSKALHKLALKPKLPIEVTDRKKQGGFAVLPIFYKNDKQRQSFVSYIKQNKIVGNFLDQKELDQFLQAYDSSFQEDSGWFWHKQFLSFKFSLVLIIAIWWDLMIEGEDIGYITEQISESPIP